MGVVAGTALVAICGDSKAGFDVLKNVTSEDEKSAEIFAKESVQLEINWDLEGLGLYIEAFVETDKGVGHAIVAKKHTNVILIEANGEVQHKMKTDDKRDQYVEEDDPIGNYGVREFYL